jgi:hypothetical protein
MSLPTTQLCSHYLRMFSKTLAHKLLPDIREPFQDQKSTKSVSSKPGAAGHGAGVVDYVCEP